MLILKNFVVNLKKKIVCREDGQSRPDEIGMRKVRTPKSGALDNIKAVTFAKAN